MDEPLTQNKRDQVLQIITSELKLENTVSEIDSAETIEEWDSFGHVLVLTALDKAFEGKLSGIKDLAQTTSVKGILEILEREKII